MFPRLVSLFVSFTATPAHSAQVILSNRSSPTFYPCAAAPLHFQPTRTITRTVAGLTEGLMFEAGKLYESTGLIEGHGPSVLNEINPVTGDVERLGQTPYQNFGEGLVKFGNYFYQLTYQDGNVYQYSMNATGDGLSLMATFQNPLREGWGLTTDGNSLIASDGSDWIYRLDPTTLKILSRIQVLDPQRQGILGLNELEFVDGQIYANIFPTNRLIRFDASSGCQTAEIDLSSLQAKLNCPDGGIECAHDSVTNGIAYDPTSGSYFLTGKSWPMIYEGNFISP